MGLCRCIVYMIMQWNKWGVPMGYVWYLYVLRGLRVVGFSVKGKCESLSSWNDNRQVPRFFYVRV